MPAAEKRAENGPRVNQQPNRQSLEIEDPGGIVVGTARGDLPGPDFCFARPGGIVAGDHMMKVMKTDRARPRAGIENEQGDRAGLQSHPPRLVAALLEAVGGKIPGARFAYR